MAIRSPMEFVCAGPQRGLSVFLVQAVMGHVPLCYTVLCSVAQLFLFALVSPQAKRHCGQLLSEVGFTTCWTPA